MFSFIYGDRAGLASRFRLRKRIFTGNCGPFIKGGETGNLDKMLLKVTDNF